MTDPSLELQICSAVRPVIEWDRVAVVAACGLEHRLPLSGSDAVLQHFGDLQQSLVQGPGADALAAGITVLVDDLRDPVDRWTLLMASVPAGFPVRSLAVVPLVGGHRRHLRSGARRHRGADAHRSGAGRVPADAVADAAVVSGVLIAGRDSKRPFTAAEVDLLEALAALVVVVAELRVAAGDLLAQATCDSASASGVGPAVGADAGSGVVPGEEVALVVGMLRERLHDDEAVATAVLRARAFSDGSTIHALARAVLAGRLDLGDITAPP